MALSQDQTHFVQRANSNNLLKSSQSVHDIQLSPSSSQPMRAHCLRPPMKRVVSAELSVAETPFHVIMSRVSRIVLISILISARERLTLV